MYMHICIHASMRIIVRTQENTYMHAMSNAHHACDVERMDLGPTRQPTQSSSDKGLWNKTSVTTIVRISFECTTPNTNKRRTPRRSSEPSASSDLNCARVGGVQPLNFNFQRLDAPEALPFDFGQFDFLPFDFGQFDCRLRPAPGKAAFHFWIRDFIALNVDNKSAKHPTQQLMITPSSCISSCTSWPSELSCSSQISWLLTKKNWLRTSWAHNLRRKGGIH